MISRKPQDMIPEMQRLYNMFSISMFSQGLLYVVTRTLCTKDVQQALYAQGRQPLTVTNSLRKIAGLALITAEENKRKVTWTLMSKHLEGKAFDIALTLKDGKTPHWKEKVDINSNNKPDYFEAGLMGESCGLIWGGRFKTPDMCHFELKE